MFVIYIYTLTPIHLLSSFVVPPLYLISLAAICPVLVRSYTEHILDMYWTTTGHVY